MPRSRSTELTFDDALAEALSDDRTFEQLLPFEKRSAEEVAALLFGGLSPDDQKEATLAATCDVCDKPIEGEKFEARTPRPSDPSDMCCVMWACETCAPQIGAKPASYWDEWIESEEAVKAGFIFLS